MRDGKCVHKVTSVHGETIMKEEQGRNKLQSGHLHNAMFAEDER